MLRRKQALQQGEGWYSSCYSATCQLAQGALSIKKEKAAEVAVVVGRCQQRKKMIALARIHLAHLVEQTKVRNFQVPQNRSSGRALVEGEFLDLKD